MGMGIKSAGMLVSMLATGMPAMAQDVPPLLVNFPMTGDVAVQEAYAKSLRARFPNDIRTSTLTALLEIDGFKVSKIGGINKASFRQAEFPCLTDYILEWDESAAGLVTELRISMNQKCV